MAIVQDPLVERLRAAGCVFAEQEAELLRAAASGAVLDELAARRLAGEPLETLLGWVDFDGLRIAVAHGVFVPRRRTELLVDLAVEGLPPDSVVVELCCGVAAVAAAVRARRPDVDVWASDIDPAATMVARKNLAPDRVVEGDLFAPLPDALRGRVAVLIANAPYVPSGEIGFMPVEARLHENHVALDGGADGLAVHARIAAGCAPWLAPSGRVIIETSERQAAGTASLLGASGLRTRIERDDERDATAVIGRHEQLGAGEAHNRLEGGSARRGRPATVAREDAAHSQPHNWVSRNWLPAGSRNAASRTPHG